MVMYMLLFRSRDKKSWLKRPPWRRDHGAARLVDAARSGCDQMNLLTSALVSRATSTHDVSLLSTRKRERAQAHHRYAPLWMHPVIDDYARFWFQGSGWRMASAQISRWLAGRSAA